MKVLFLKFPKTKRQGDKEAKRQRDKETKRQRDKETKRQRDKETKRQDKLFTFLFFLLNIKIPQL